VSVQVRHALAADLPVILEVHRAAFGSDVEPTLVADLLASPDAAPLISVVGENEGGVVAHVLLSSGRAPGVAELRLSILAPLAVLPAHQNQGLGDAVSRFALAAAREREIGCVCVLGDPRYYGRFGFVARMPDGPWPPAALAAEHHWAWQSLWLTPVPDAIRARLDGVCVQWAPPLQPPELWGP
jgi:putative acetyltransferase